MLAPVGIEKDEQISRRSGRGESRRSSARQSCELPPSNLVASVSEGRPSSSKRIDHPGQQPRPVAGRRAGQGGRSLSPTFQGNRGVGGRWKLDGGKAPEVDSRASFIEHKGRTHRSRSCRASSSGNRCQRGEEALRSQPRKSAAEVSWLPWRQENRVGGSIVQTVHIRREFPSTIRKSRWNQQRQLRRRSKPLKEFLLLQTTSPG